MFDNPRFTAQDALDLVEANKHPLNFGSGVAVYRAAVKRLAKTSVPGLITGDLSVIPMDLNFIDLFFAQLDRQPPLSKKELERQSDWKSRLRIIARRLQDVPVVRTTPEWQACLMAVRELAKARDLNEHDLIPVTSTMRQAAIEDGFEPFELTSEWLSGRFRTMSHKQRNSLQRGARLFDDLWPQLPPHLRPVQLFGPITIISRKRKSQSLPPRVAEQLEAYLAKRVRGTVLPGLNREVSVDVGIKPDQSTAIYRQALGWLFDSLCALGMLTPGANLEISDLARLDWLSMVAAEGIAHHDSSDDDCSPFPWQPIQPETIHNRILSLTLMFGNLCPGFRGQVVEVHDPDTGTSTTVDAAGLQKLLSARVRNEMTDAHKTFCRAIVANEDKQRLLLNMHMICYADAQARWKTYRQQRPHEQMQTMNRCLLAAILALVVNIPFRARTVTEMVMGGTRPDLTLAKDNKRIEFHIAAARMKVPKVFDAVLEDSQLSRPRQIIDWFIAGPRQELLTNPLLLRPQNRDPDRLFGGIGTARYNRILLNWSEEIGLPMSTHLFRHALASILINSCGVSLEEVAGLLGNTAETVERNYLFHDLVRRRSKTLHRLADHRKHLTGAHHPGRKRKS